MVRIRLSRTGRTNYATYRVVVTNLREKRDSKALELVGHYLPHTKELKLNAERIQYWLSVGAQPSDTVRGLLVKEGILKAEKKSDKKNFKKTPGKKSTERAAKRAEAEEVKATVLKEPKAPTESVKEEPKEEVTSTEVSESNEESTTENA